VLAGPPPTCNTNLTFGGIPGEAVGTHGPFSFPGWTYDSETPSDPPAFSQAILNQASSTQVINITYSDVNICFIAASGTNAVTTATFTGTTYSGPAPNPVTASLPSWASFSFVSFDESWQDVESIIITTTGSPTTYTTELWAISFASPL
jgi:hypothetical protein